MREVVTGVWESDMGLWNTDAAGLLRRRRSLDADELAIFMNVTPEFASSAGGRSPVEVARSVAVSSLPDAILISGPMAGAEPSMSTLADVRRAVPSRDPCAFEHRGESGQHRRLPRVRRRVHRR